MERLRKDVHGIGVAVRKLSEKIGARPCPLFYPFMASVRVIGPRCSSGRARDAFMSSTLDSWCGQAVDDDPIPFRRFSSGGEKHCYEHTLVLLNISLSAGILLL